MCTTKKGTTWPPYLLLIFWSTWIKPSQFCCGSRKGCSPWLALDEVFKHKDIEELKQFSRLLLPKNRFSFPFVFFYPPWFKSSILLIDCITKISGLRFNHKLTLTHLFRIDLSPPVNCICNSCPLLAQCQNKFLSNF